MVFYFGGRVSMATGRIVNFVQGKRIGRIRGDGLGE